MIDERVSDASCTEEAPIVDLMNGRTILVPLAWFRASRTAHSPSAPTGYYSPDGEAEDLPS
ncbi:hypothetical protein QQS45_08670 [Alteriqipengyuania flavescens]|uniref:hypothetical protein n=1 Tax=Alteriqipengyuania flavescens TaxID=3053610 RepID=UPI0025B54192|nr:hypothetical protein [Alteriqipengyuania flavescens]WJY17716.1 hypothetical protein QQW98_08665 [Alteriqipengyuania flavescens]WJY23659.1 hypothetical protein QQS45_08670 [Alteriqipengyuania flavescens]